MDTVGDTSVSHYKSTIPIEMTRPPPVKRETVKKEELPKMITQEQQSNEYAELVSIYLWQSPLEKSFLFQTNIRVGVSEVEYADLLEKVPIIVHYRCCSFTTTCLYYSGTILLPIEYTGRYLQQC